MKRLTALTLLILLSGCGIHSSQKASAVLPIRTQNEQVILVKCKDGYACLDLINFKNLLKNETNTEIYIEQLQNIIKELVEPVK